MIEEMMKDKLSETKLMMSYERRKEIRKYLDYYCGMSTEHTYETTLQEMPSKKFHQL